MRYGSLFAGIGGFDLGFDRAGLKCKWQVEKDPYCWQVLWEKWPKVDKWDDVKTFPPDFSNEWNVDVICGGFPCQDISDAGTRVGISGERSGLWSEFARVVRVLRPRFVVVENSAALLRRGAGQVFGDLAACGYSLEWDCLPAIAFGARHIRDRLFIVATTDAIHDADGNQRGGGVRRLETDLRGMGFCGPINPEFLELLMGFPVAWTELEPSATPSSRTSRNGSAEE